MQASTPFIMSWTCFGSFSNPAVSFQGRCRKERRDWGNYRSLGQRIEDRLRSPTYLRAPQTQTPSRALTGRSVRVNGREIETKSVLRMRPLKLLLWCFFCSSGLEVTAVSLFISVWEEHTTTQEAKAGLDRFSAVIAAFVSDKKKRSLQVLWWHTAQGQLTTSRWQQITLQNWSEIFSFNMSVPTC